MNGKFAAASLWLISAANVLSAADIRLAVIEEDTGTPLAGTSVELVQSPNQEKKLLKTDGFGFLRLPVVEDRPRSVTVRVSHAGHVPKIVSWSTENPAFVLPEEFVLKLEKTHCIGGIVTDENGKPIEGAEALITIRGSSCGLSQEIHDDIWEWKAVTDAGGRWVFDEAPSSLKYLDVRLRHPDYVDAGSSRNTPKAEEFFSGTAHLVMKAGRVIEGTVRDKNGTPLKDVEVLMNQHGASSNTQPDYSTDAHGHFVIRNAPAQSPSMMQSGVLLAFFKKGFAPEMSILAGRGKFQSMDIVLAPGNKLAGRVTDPEGKPLENVWVIPDHWRGVRPFGCIRLKTGADGGFVWEDAPADEVIFDVLNPGYLPLRGVPLQAGKDKVLAMKPPVSVTGTVVDADSGAPIPAFEIQPGVSWTNNRNQLSRASGLPGKDGKFVWTFYEPARLSESDGRTADPGAHFLRVQSPGYFPSDSRLIKDSEDSVQVEIKLRKGTPIAFSVLEKNGKPVAGAVAMVAGEGNPLRIADGKLIGRGDLASVTTDESGRAVLPPTVGNPVLVLAHPESGFATPMLDELRNGRVTLTPWGRLVVQSPAIQPGKEIPFYLNYAPRGLPTPAGAPPFSINNRGEIDGEGRLVFKGVKPGKVRIGRYHQPDDTALEVEVPEGRETSVSMPAHDGIASIAGKIELPKDLAGLDWADQRGNLQTSSDPRPWPKGLSIEERRTWLEQTPEGKMYSRKHRIYSLKVNEDGSFALPDVAPGRYALTIPVYSGHAGEENRKLLGLYRDIVLVPTREELARNAPPAPPELDDLFIEMRANPPFFRCLQKSDHLPAFTAKPLSGPAISNETLHGKNAILVFYSSTPEQFPELSDDINRTCAQARAQGVKIHCLNTDEEQETAARFLGQHPLSCEVGWVGDDEAPELLKQFGPVWSPTILAVNPDGSIRGRYTKVSEAMDSFQN